MCSAKIGIQYSKRTFDKLHGKNCGCFRKVWSRASLCEYSWGSIFGFSFICNFYWHRNCSLLYNSLRPCHMVHMIWTISLLWNLEKFSKRTFKVSSVYLLTEKKHLTVDRGLLSRTDDNQSKVRLTETGLANLNKPVEDYANYVYKEEPTSIQVISKWSCNPALNYTVTTPQ